MTKAERERVRRHAAVIAIVASAPRPVDAEEDRWSAVRRWRGEDAEGEAEAPDDPD